MDASLFATAVRNTEAAGGAEVAFQWTYEVPGRGEPVATEAPPTMRPER